jgi:CDI toxin restriction endonuclease-like domain
MDFFNRETGALLSLETLNLGAKSYQSFARLNRALHGYVDEADAFTEGARGVDVIRPAMIKSRSLAVVLPQVGVSSQQAWALYSSYEYASWLGIDMTYVVPR